MFLLQPTHKKYIKLLRDRVKSGNPVIMTKKDRADFLKLFRTTKQRLPRHQGLYRITLNAIKRSPEDINSEEIFVVLDNRAISVIERTLAKAEWKSLCVTLQSAYLIPLLRALIKRMGRSKNGKSLL